MSPNRERRITALVDEAASRGSSAQNAFLDENLGSDAVLADGGRYRRRGAF